MIVYAHVAWQWAPSNFRASVAHRPYTHSHHLTSAMSTSGARKLRRTDVSAPIGFTPIQSPTARILHGNLPWSP